MPTVRSRKLALACFAALALVLLSVGTATAAERYASPGGSGTTCTQPAPCAITTAINDATSFDQVIVGNGTYGSLAAPVLDIRYVSNFLTIRGESPSARPTIYASNSGGSSAAFYPGSNSTISDLDIVSVASPTTYYGLSALFGSVVNRVSVSGTALSATCAFDGTISNASCSATGAGVAAIETSIGGSGSGPVGVLASDWMNVTAVSMNGIGFSGTADSGIDFDLTIANSVFRGSSNDIYLSSDNVNFADADINIRNSNFTYVATIGTGTTVTSSAAANNQALEPQFVNVAGGNLRPLETSPTVNAGDDSAVVGAYDAGGAARIFGPHVDIGAYEWAPAPPPVVAPPATTITDLKALTKKFTSAKSGAAFQPASKRPKTKKGKKPVGTLISFTLSQADTVKFTLEKGSSGRKSGSKCVKKTSSNANKKKCTRYIALKGTESVIGVAGKNTFWFTGRWNKKALAAGSSFVMRGTPIKASTGNEPGVLNPRPIKTFPK
ncbi:MAG: choice-of-anchor Q domain-containing protein [Solirubrobacterales bacterium]